MATKYTLDMDVSGNAKKELENISKSIGDIRGQAGQLSSMGDSMGKAMDQVASNTRTAAIAAVAQQIQGLSQKFVELSDTVRTRGKEFIQDIFTETAAFQDTQADLKFAFGSQWESVYDEVLKDSAKLTFSFQDVAQLASGLGRMKINPFGGVDESSQKFLSKTGEYVRALEVIQDAADASGRDSQKFMFSLREAISGDMKSIRDALDLPKEVTEKWKKAIDAAKDPQAKYNTMIKELATLYGGAGALKAQNWNKTMAQIPDLLQQIKAAAGAEGIKYLTADMAEFVDVLGDIAKDKDIMKALAEGFTILIYPIRLAVQWGTKLVGFLGDLVKQYPWLPKVVAIFVAFNAAVLILVGSFAGLILAIGGVIAGVMAIGSEVLLPLLAASVFLLPLMVLLGVVLMSIGLGIKSISDTSKRELQTPISMFEKIKVVFSALYEMISTFNGTTSEMSIETYNALKKSGMEGFVDGVMKVWLRLNQLWDGFTATMDDLSLSVGPTALELLGELKKAFLLFADMLGLTTLQTAATNKSGKDWANTGRDIATSLIVITKMMLGLMTTAIKVFNWMMEWKIIHGLLIAIGGLLAMATVAVIALTAAGMLLMAPFMALALIVGGIVMGIVMAIEKVIELKKLAEDKNKTKDQLLKEGNAANTVANSEMEKLKAEKDRRAKAGLAPLTWEEQEKLLGRETPKAKAEKMAAMGGIPAEQLNAAGVKLEKAGTSFDWNQLAAQQGAGNGPVTLSPESIQALAGAMSKLPAPQVNVEHIAKATNKANVSVNGGF